MTTAILALQGAFLEHALVLDRLHEKHFEIRQRKDLDRGFDALILPGGESTVMGKLLRELGLFGPLREKIASGLPVFGTCAGLLLLAEEIDGGSPCFGSMGIRVKRNAYGRQLGSFYAEEDFAGEGRIPMTFIRAPYIEEVYSGTRILARAGGHIVAARQGKQLVTAFHPEVSDNTAVHEYFIRMAGK